MKIGKFKKLQNAYERNNTFGKFICENQENLINSKGYSLIAFILFALSTISYCVTIVKNFLKDNREK